MTDTTKKRIDKRNRAKLARAAGRRIISFEAPEEFHALVGRLAEVMGLTRGDAIIVAVERFAEDSPKKKQKK